MNLKVQRVFEFEDDSLTKTKAIHRLGLLESDEELLESDGETIYEIHAIYEINAI